MKILSAALAAAASLACLPFDLAADSCRYEEERNASVAAGNAVRAGIAAGPGKLKIQGRAGLEEVRIRGMACASRREALEQIELVAERRGDEIVIEAKSSMRGGQWRDQALLHLEIDVPETLALEIADSSGGVDVRGVGALRLQDSSGNIRIAGVGGALSVHDGSGKIDISGVRGDVDLRDGSGDLSVADVDGGVRIRDGSGDIEIRRVAGDATVARDGSGDIAASQVEGDFKVKRDGSGSVRHKDIGGRVSVPD